MKKKKLYLVKREVYAYSIKEAVKEDGEIYEIQLADERFQDKKNPNVGFENEQ